MIFTDLDGTLLDHHSYSYLAAMDALRRINDRKIPLIFCSSKTNAEVSELRESMGNTAPYVVENGGAVIVPAGYFSGYGENDHVEVFGLRYNEILNILANLRKGKQYSFRGFFDISTRELMESTGLTTDQAERAKLRLCSEPILWESEEKDLEEFQNKLEKYGLRLIRGGRFYHVMGQNDKAAGVQWLMDRYRNDHLGTEFITVALGDSANDQAMLEAADISVVITPVTGEAIKLEACGSVIYPDKTGPEGWNEAIHQILDQHR